MAQQCAAMAVRV